MRPFEIFEHTADVGLRIRGTDLKSLFRNAGEGLFSVITDAEAVAAAAEKSTVRILAKSTEDLLLKWLRELLYRFDARGTVMKGIKRMDISETQLETEIETGQFDPEIHEQKTEVKAVTYHGFKLEKKDPGWVAEVILDI